MQSDHAKSKNREESRIACLVDRVDSILPSRSEPPTKTLTATQTDILADVRLRCCSKELFNIATSYSVKPANVPSESAKPA